MATSSAPTHNVYTVEDRGEGEDPFWLKIGAAWPHKDGRGYNITLSALPLDNRLVLRVPADGAEEAPPAAKEKPAKTKR
jgi:hypothetical protein